MFQARCVVCHNEKALGNQAVSGGLALDSFGALRKGVGGRAVFTPGKSGASELYLRLVTTSAAKLMPKGGPPLPKAQIAAVKEWIDAGAKPDAATEKPAARAGAESAPMPPPPGLTDVSVATRIAPTPDLVKKGTPQGATLAFALKIGPLPPATSLAFSPDGKTLAVGGYRAVVLFDAVAARPLGAVTGLPGPVLSLAFRPDGAQIAVSGGVSGVSGEVRVFDAKTLAPVGPALRAHADVVYSAAWSADGARLATAGHDKTARLWEWPSGKELFLYKDHSDAVTKVAFAPDGKSVYTASMDRNVRRFSAEDGKLVRSFTGHAEGVTALALNADGSRVVSSGVEPRLRWWNTGDGGTVHFGDAHGGPVNDIAFSKGGQRVVSASADGTVRVWDGSGAHQRALEGAGDWLHAAAVSPDARLVAGAGADGAVRVWEAETARLRLTLLFWPPARPGGATEWLALAPEGYYAASPAWAKRLRPRLAGQDLTGKPALAPFVQKLASPETVQKGLKGENVEPAALPAPPAPPAKPTGKPAG